MSQRPIRRFFKENVRPYWALQAETALCLLIVVALSLADPLLLKVIIDRALGDGNASLLLLLVAALGVLLLFRTAFRVFSVGLTSYSGLRILFDFRRRAYEHAQTLSPLYFRGERTGDILARLTSDIDVLQRAAAHTVVNAAQDSLTILGIVGVLAWLDWKLALVVVAVLPVLALGLSFLNRRLRNEGLRARVAISDLMSFLQERITGMRLVQEFNRQRHEARRHVQASRPWIRHNLNLSLIGAWQLSVADLVTTGAFILVFLLGGLRTLDGTMSLGTLIAFYTLSTRLYRPVAGLVDVNVDLQVAATALERVYQLIDTKSELPEPARPDEPAIVRGELRLEGVRVVFGETAVLDGVNLHVRPGETVALVGPSGSGKSTLAALMARYLDPAEGRVLLDGHDLRGWRTRRLRQAVGLVPQDTLIFDASLAENLRYANPRATDADLRAALAATALDAMVEDLPAGLDTQLGPSGARLSGGERQRLALARALLQDPAVLILDEASSALDPTTERRVLNRLFEQRGQRTLIVIAHRLGGLSEVDRIFVLDRGRLVEQGTHDELLTAAGLYRSLWDDQLRRAQ